MAEYIPNIISFLAAAVPALVALWRQRVSLQHQLNTAEGRFRDTILARVDKLQSEIDAVRAENVKLQIKNGALEVQVGILRTENSQLREKIVRIEQSQHGTH